MPVFYFCRNVNTVARVHLDCFLALLLIIATSGNAYEDLSIAIFCMMNMPVIAAARLKCHIENTDLAG